MWRMSRIIEFAYLIRTVTCRPWLGTERGGFADGTLGPDGGAEFNRPEGIAVDAQGNLWVADTFNCALRKIILPQ